MKSLNPLYQQAVDLQAERIATVSPEEFLGMNDFGLTEGFVNEKKITIGYWRYQKEDEVFHLVFKTTRRWFLFLYMPFLSGVKYEKGKLSRMSGSELADYD